MKKISSITFLSLGLLAMSSCTKDKTTVINEDGSSTTTTEIGVNDQKVDSAKVKINNDLDKTGKSIEKGAKELKEDVKDLTSDAAAAVEKGAKNVKEDMKK